MPCNPRQRCLRNSEGNSVFYVAMSDREPTRWQHNRLYPHPINSYVYTYDSRLYCCETVDAHCSNIIKS